jgi:hypothetical protein
VKSKEENSEVFCPNYIQEFGLWMKEINLLYYILFYLPRNKGVENILQQKMLTAVTINWKAALVGLAHFAGC